MPGKENMEQLTINHNNWWEIKETNSQDCKDICVEPISCIGCPVQKSFDRLATYVDTGLEPEEIILLKQNFERKVCTGCWLKDGAKISENIGELKMLLEQAAEEIENCYGRETELSERIREQLK